MMASDMQSRLSVNDRELREVILREVRFSRECCTYVQLYFNKVTISALITVTALNVLRETTKRTMAHHYNRAQRTSCHT